MSAIPAVVIATALASVAPALQPVGLAFQSPVGLSDEEAARTQQALLDELAGLGISVEPSPPLDSVCAADLDCVENARAGAATPLLGLLVVELVRLGPVTQLNAVGASATAKVTASRNLEEAELQTGPLLPDNVRAWLKAIRAPRAPVREARPPAPKKSDGFTGMQIGAIAAAGGGAVALIAGGALIGVSESTLTNPKSVGDEKSGAIGLGWTGVGATALGAVGIAAGAALFFLGGE